MPDPRQLELIVRPEAAGNREDYRPTAVRLTRFPLWLISEQDIAVT
jgi:hypothetical protein